MNCKLAMATESKIDRQEMAQICMSIAGRCEVCPLTCLSEMMATRENKNLFKGGTMVTQALIVFNTAIWSYVLIQLAKAILG